MKRMLTIALLLLMTAVWPACGEKTGLQDGYYTAQASQFNFGWKEYVTIMVKGGNIVSVEYNAENASGFIKSWDNAYMQNMLGIMPVSFWKDKAKRKSTPLRGLPPPTDLSKSSWLPCLNKPERAIPASQWWIRLIDVSISGPSPRHGAAGPYFMQETDPLPKISNPSVSSLIPYTKGGHCSL